jgi:hypothetical protein
MRRVVYVMGVVFVATIIPAVLAVAFVGYRGYHLNMESKAFVNQAVTDVVQKWDRAELLKRASPDLLKVASPEQISTLFEQLAGFGRLIHYDGATGQAITKDGAGAGIRAHYDAAATFENGQARFHIDLRKVDERRMINSFYVEMSPAATTTNVGTH